MKTTKNLLVFFLAMSVFLVASVSAATSEIATIDNVKLNGIDQDATLGTVSVVAEEPLYVTVYFTALEDASDVKVKVEVEGVKIDVEETTDSFDVEAGSRYSKTLRLVLPHELKDDLSDDLELNVKIWNKDYKTETATNDITLRVQRPTYDVGIMSINTASVVSAGETVPVDFVLKNTGYNDLDDVYVTVRIPALNMEKKSYVGDMVAIENDSTDDDDDTDTLRGRFYMDIPYNAAEGIYAVEVEVENDDLTMSDTTQVVVQNDFPTSTIATSSVKQVSVGETAEYDLMIVNPTNKLKVFTIVPQTSEDFTSSVDNTLVAVPAGSTKNVKVTASAQTEGTYNFNVQVLSGSAVAETVALTMNVEGSAVTSPMVILTVVLAIIFLVLLVILIVLLGKKPEKADDFGESYY